MSQVSDEFLQRMVEQLSADRGSGYQVLNVSDDAEELALALSELLQHRKEVAYEEFDSVRIEAGGGVVAVKRSSIRGHVVLSAHTTLRQDEGEQVISALREAFTAAGAPSSREVTVSMEEKVAMMTVAAHLASYTPDGSQPTLTEIPGLLELLLRQRDQGAAAGMVGPDIKPGSRSCGRAILDALVDFQAALETAAMAGDGLSVTLQPAAFDALAGHVFNLGAQPPGGGPAQLRLNLPSGGLTVRRALPYEPIRFEMPDGWFSHAGHQDPTVPPGEMRAVMQRENRQHLLDRMNAAAREEVERGYRQAAREVAAGVSDEPKE